MSIFNSSRHFNGDENEKMRTATIQEPQCPRKHVRFFPSVEYAKKTLKLKTPVVQLQHFSKAKLWVIFPRLETENM